MRPRVVAATAITIATLALGTVAPAGAARDARSCRDACARAVAGCVDLGFRRKFCAREIVSQCRHGLRDCTLNPATVPVCATTTTILPAPSGACLGPAGCEAESTGITSTVASAEELRDRLLGSWYDCKADLGAEPFDAAGIEFAQDGQWWYLRSDAGGLTRETGFGQAGTYEIIDTSVMNGPGHFQLNLNLNTGYLVILQWTLSSTPQLLRLDNNGVQRALYSHMPGAPACEGQSTAG